VRVAAALLLCGPFTPLLFQGEEWGASTPFRYFTAHRDPALGRAVTEGRRNEFARFGWDPADGPDPQAPNTFAASKLDWAEVDRPPHAGLLAWYERLVQLRRRLPELSDPRLASISVEVDEEAGTLEVRRGRVRLLANLAGTPHRFTVAAEPAMLAASNEDGTTIEGTTVSVGPDAGVIVLTREVADLSRDEGAHHG
jgi:maltooligosyltrehalose trehalohydrolase